MKRFQNIIGFICTVSALTIACGGSSSGPTASSGQNQEAPPAGSPNACPQVQATTPQLADHAYEGLVPTDTCSAGTMAAVCPDGNTNFADWGCVLTDGNGTAFSIPVDVPLCDPTATTLYDMPPNENCGIVPSTICILSPGAPGAPALPQVAYKCESSFQAQPR